MGLFGELWNQQTRRDLKWSLAGMCLHREEKRWDEISSKQSGQEIGEKKVLCNIQDLTSKWSNCHLFSPLFVTGSSRAGCIWWELTRNVLNSFISLYIVNMGWNCQSWTICLMTRAWKLFAMDQTSWEGWWYPNWVAFWLEVPCLRGSKREVGDELTSLCYTLSDKHSGSSLLVSPHHPKWFILESLRLIQMLW